MALNALAPVVELEFDTSRFSGSADSTTPLGQTFYVKAIISNLLPDTMYRSVFERTADGYWTEFLPVDEYHNKYFHSGDGIEPVEVTLAHPNWGPADGAPTTYEGRVHVFALTNPAVQAYSNVLALEWTWNAVEPPAP